MQYTVLELQSPEHIPYNALFPKLSKAAAEDSDAVDQRPQKRCKIESNVATGEPIGDGGEAWVTLRRLDIHLTCPVSPDLSYSEWKDASQGWHDVETPVFSVRLAKPRSNPWAWNEFDLSIRGYKGSATHTQVVEGSPTSSQLGVIHAAAYLVQPNRVTRPRSTFSLSAKPNNLAVSNTSASHGKSKTIHLVLTIRILLPSAETILEFPGLPQRPVLQEFFPPNTLFRAGPWSPRDFYDHVGSHEETALDEPFAADGLQCNLYPFQQRAVRWMLQREGAPCSQTQKQGPEGQSLQHGFVSFIDDDGRSAVISRLLGLASRNTSIVNDSGRLPKGIGILAEEMGLGKTVEMAGLICTHRSPDAERRWQGDNRTLQRTGATLIITPPSILQQWDSELKILAPKLKVAMYYGMKVESSKAEDVELQSRCIENNIVLTTYSVLARDIYHAEQPTKTLRHDKKYKKRLSPLTQLYWWRVVLDEAQLVESGVSNAAKTAGMIPCRNKWCVSGTPARNAKDLLGLLSFLKLEPYCSVSNIWGRLVNHHRDAMWDIFSKLSFRHTKAQVRDEIIVPAQKRIVITVPFTPIEEQHYLGLFQEAVEDCGFNPDGSPIEGKWDPEKGPPVEKMRVWLARLRQTCLHPEVGGRNRKALGSKGGPLRTIREVLKVMIDQNEAAIRADERNLMMSQLRRGQMFEQDEKTQEALDVWLGTLEAARQDVKECRESLETEQAKSALSKSSGTAVDTEDAEASRLTVLRSRLRGSLEIEHVCNFFVGNAYYQLKTKDIEAQKQLNTTAKDSKHDDCVKDASHSVSTDTNRCLPRGSSQAEEVTGHDAGMDSAMSEPAMTEQAKFFEAREEEFYEKAKLLRRELLAEPRKRAGECMAKVKSIRDDLASFPAIPSLKDPGGIQTRSFYERAVELLGVLQRQTDKALTWRRKSVELLVLPLVDEDDSDLKGDEYELSTKQQDEVYVFVDALRAIESDRHVAVIGQKNELIDHEMDVLLRDAREQKGHSPALLLELLKIRYQLKPAKELGSVKSLITELREFKNELRGSVERKNAQSAAETLIVNDILQSLQRISTEQIRAASALDKELALLKDTMNMRLEFYRQLQAISDTVAPLEEDVLESARATQLGQRLRSEDQMQARIASLHSKRRYLLYLRDEASEKQPQRICIICTATFETGVLTSCGHVFCSECLRLWWSQHRNCPTCKKHLKRTDFNEITYKPQELLMEEEVATRSDKSAHSSDDGSIIYTGVRESVLGEIQNVDLNGSFGTKIDTLARHLLWIREHDAGAKSIIFSQFRDFLDVLSRAFSHFRIGYASIEKKDGIEKFKNDPSIECFFLHAKAHSSGLNLVNATHVFLCEPLINPALELQAISRVHRIGQYHETTVWMYLVDGTVERSIYNKSIQKRLAHVGRLQTANKDESDPSAEQDKLLETQLEAANSAELEQTSLSHLLSKGGSGGELVKQEDLWDCLFSSRPKQASKASESAALEVAHHLGAEAAEARKTVLDQGV